MRYDIENAQVYVINVRPLNNAVTQEGERALTNEDHSLTCTHPSH